MHQVEPQVIGTTEMAKQPQLKIGETAAASVVTPSIGGAGDTLHTAPRMTHELKATGRTTRLVGDKTVEISRKQATGGNMWYVGHDSQY